MRHDQIDYRELAQRISDEIKVDDRLFGTDIDKIEKVLRAYLTDSRVSIGEVWCIRHRQLCSRLMTGFQWRTITYSCTTCQHSHIWWSMEYQWHVPAL